MNNLPRESNLKGRRNLEPLPASDGDFQHTKIHSSSSFNNIRSSNFVNQAVDAKSPYGSISQGFRKAMPHEIACKIGCNGKKCKYETSNWPSEEMAIPGIFSHWYSSNFYLL